ncbi:hypothetical protein L7F22_042295 [Adiantum nelumboides]|nr:hypothetical protein [Adiantum nelumboides]
MDYFDEFDDNLGAMPTKAQRLLLGHTGPEGNNAGGGVRDSIYSSNASPIENEFHNTTTKASSGNSIKKAFRSTMVKPFRRSKRTESGVSSSAALSLKSPSMNSRDSWGGMYTPSTANSMHASANMWPQTPTYKPNRSSNYSTNMSPRRTSLVGGVKEDLTKVAAMSPTLIASFRENIANGKSTKSLPPIPKRKNTIQNEFTLLEKLTATGAKPLIPPPSNRSRHNTFSSPSSQRLDFMKKDEVPELPPIPSSFRNSKAPSQVSYLEPVDNAHQHEYHSPSSNPSEMDPFYLQKFAESPAWFDYESSSTTAESPLQPMTENTTVNNSPIIPSPLSKDHPLYKLNNNNVKTQRKPWERPLCAPPPLELGDLSNVSNQIMTTAMKQPQLPKKASKPTIVEEQVLPDSPILRDVESPETALPYLNHSPIPGSTTAEAQRSSLLAKRTKRNIFEQFKKVVDEVKQETYPTTDDIELISHGDTPLDQFPGSPIDTDSILDSISEAHSVLDSERLSSFFPMPPTRNSTGQNSLHISTSLSDISTFIKPEKINVNKEKTFKRKTGSLDQLNKMIDEIEGTMNNQSNLISKSVSQLSLISDDTASNIGHAIEHSRSDSLTILSKKFIQISGIDRPQLVVQGKRKESSGFDGDDDDKSIKSETEIFKATLQADSMDGQETLNRSGSFDGTEKRIQVNKTKVTQKTTKTKMNDMDLCRLLDIPSITETIATPMEEKDLNLSEDRMVARQRGSTFSFWGNHPSNNNKRFSSSHHSRKTSTNGSTPSLISSSSQSADRRTSFQSASSHRGTTLSSPKQSSEKWQNNRPQSIDLENGHPSGSYFSYDSDLGERSQQTSSQEHHSKSPKMIPLKSLLRSVKSYTAVQPAIV